MYRVFIPAPIGGRDFPLTSEASTAVSTATRELARMADDSPSLARLGSVAQNLLRSESVASSRIEGIAVSPKRLARVALGGSGGRRADNRAVEVLGNVEAMRRAIDRGGEARALAVADILDIHRTLLRHTADRAIAGLIRDQQNWIGGSDFNPVGAAYVPPPAEQVDELLEDLCRFAAREDLPPVAKAAIAHAQFETIHPFADGNGRTGRALVYALLRQSGEIGSYVPPISLALGGEQRSYVGGLEAYRDGEVSAWCTLFAEATALAARAARELAESVRAYQESWLERLGNPRSDATSRLLVAILPEQPVLDVPTAQRLTGRSHVAVGKAIDQLEQAGILVRLNERKWGRLWECGEVLDLAEDFERSVSAP